MLIKIHGRNGIAPGGGFTRKRHVTVVALFRIGGNLPVTTAPVRSGVFLWFGGDGRDQCRCGLLALRPSFIEQSLLVLVSRAPTVARVTLASE